MPETHTSFEGLPYTRHLFKPIENGETAGCHADVYLPSESIARPYPVALAIHGGGFCTGDTHHIFMGHFRYLLERGFCVVSAEYRLAPHARLRHYREDWVDSYRWIKNGLHQATDGKVDPTRVFVFGGSAGGTATLFLGLDVLTAGLPPPNALYALYPAIQFDSISPAFSSSVDYCTMPEIIATCPPEHQVLLIDLIAGPVATAYDCKTETSRPLTGRRVWYDLLDLPEILPYHLRSKGLAIFSVLTAIGQVFNTYVNAIALGAIGWKYYIIFIVTDLIQVIVAYFIIVETRGLTLEDIALLFDKQERRAVGTL